MNVPHTDPIKARISAAWSSRAATQRDWQRLMKIKRRWVVDHIEPSADDEAFMLTLIQGHATLVAAPGEAATCVAT